MQGVLYRGADCRSSGAEKISFGVCGISRCWPWAGRLWPRPWSRPWSRPRSSSWPPSTQVDVCSAEEWGAGEGCSQKQVASVFACQHGQSLADRRCRVLAEPRTFPVCHRFCRVNSGARVCVCVCVCCYPSLPFLNRGKDNWTGVTSGLQRSRSSGGGLVRSHMRGRMNTNALICVHVGHLPKDTPCAAVLHG